MIEILISLQGTILIYMFFGFILKKNHMINEQASMFLSRFVLEFVLPINIFNSCDKNIFLINSADNIIIIKGNITLNIESKDNNIFDLTNP